MMVGQAKGGDKMGIGRKSQAHRWFATVIDNLTTSPIQSPKFSYRLVVDRKRAKHAAMCLSPSFGEGSGQHVRSQRSFSTPSHQCLLNIPLRFGNDDLKWLGSIHNLYPVWFPLRQPQVTPSDSLMEMQLPSLKNSLVFHPLQSRLRVNIQKQSQVGHKPVGGNPIEFI